MTATKGFMELFLFAASCPSSSLASLLFSLLFCFKGIVIAYFYPKSSRVVKQFDLRCSYKIIILIIMKNRADVVRPSVYQLRAKKTSFVMWFCDSNFNI